MARNTDSILASCPGADVPHEVQWKPIAIIGSRELEERVNAMSCHGGRGWHPDFQMAWIEAERAAAAAASPATAPAVEPPPPPAGL